MFLQGCAQICAFAGLCPDCLLACPGLCLWNPQRGLMSRLAPPLCSIVSGAAEGGDQGVGQVGAMVEGSLEMLAMLLRKAPAEVACAVHALAMAPVMRLMTSGSDAGQLQSGTEVLRLFFKAGGEAMLSWNGMNAESSLQVCLPADRFALPRHSKPGFYY